MAVNCERHPSAPVIVNHYPQHYCWECAVTVTGDTEDDTRCLDHPNGIIVRIANNPPDKRRWCVNCLGSAWDPKMPLTRFSPMTATSNLPAEDHMISKNERDSLSRAYAELSRGLAKLEDVLELTVAEWKTGDKAIYARVMRKGMRKSELLVVAL